jgi:predicted AlkP superfamily phosphohydrolase/phosphomutase
MTSTQKKIFVVSLDGATFDVLRPLADQGYLPNLNKIMKDRIAADLESVIPPVTAPAWTSFMTGKHPGKHGIFDFTHFEPLDCTTKLNNAQNIRSKTIWQILSEKGKRVIVVNMPFTYPPTPVNGVIVSGWDAPSIESNFTYPADLRTRIFDKIPDYGSTLDLSLWNYLPAKSDQQFNQFIAKLVRSFQQGLELASFLLDERDWDVCMVHFQQTDWIQHKLWSSIEEACKNRSNKSERIEKVRECYGEFDRLFGELLQKVEALQPTIIVLSDHGFGRHHGVIRPNYFLMQWGYFHLIDRAQTRLQGVFRKSRFSPVRKLYDLCADIKHNIFDGRRSLKYKSWGEQAHEQIPQQKSFVDWGRTKVAAVEGSETAHLFVNLVGRGPQGIVQPRGEYEDLVAELIKKFQGIRHPDTGEKLLVRVARGSEIYPDSRDGILLPDIILIPQDGYGFSMSVSDAAPKVSNEGNHRHNGILLMTGNDLKRPVEKFRPNLIDIAPTILHLLGLPVPTDMDGRVLEELFPNLPAVQYEQVNNGKTLDSSTHYSAEEAELIEQRLKGLGYVE